MQKVIVVKATANDSNKPLEMEFPEVNKYLEKGFKVVNLQQISPSQSTDTVFLIFILQAK